MINLRGLQYCAKQTAHQDLAGDKNYWICFKKKKEKKSWFFLNDKKIAKVQGEILLLALYKSQRHSNTLILLNKSIWLSLKAWILPNDGNV